MYTAYQYAMHMDWCSSYPPVRCTAPLTSTSLALLLPAVRWHFKNFNFIWNFETKKWTLEVFCLSPYWLQSYGVLHSTPASIENYFLGLINLRIKFCYFLSVKIVLNFFLEMFWEKFLIRIDKVAEKKFKFYLEVFKDFFRF